MQAWQELQVVPVARTLPEAALAVATAFPTTEQFLY